MASATFDPTTLVTEIAADHVMFIGRGKSHSMVHLIEGTAKAKRDTYSACGQSVKNTGRQPNGTETICKKCQTEPAVEPTVDPIERVLVAAVESSPTDAEIDEIVATAADVIEPAGFTLNAATLDRPADVTMIVIDEAPGETVDAVATLVSDACYHCGADGATVSETIDGDAVMVHQNCQPQQTAPRAARSVVLVTKADGTPKWRVKKACTVCGRLLKVKRGTENPTHKACRA